MLKLHVCHLPVSLHFRTSSLTFIIMLHYGVMTRKVCLAHFAHAHLAITIQTAADHLFW